MKTIETLETEAEDARIRLAQMELFFKEEGERQTWHGRTAELDNWILELGEARWRANMADRDLCTARRHYERDQAARFQKALDEANDETVGAS